MTRDPARSASLLPSPPLRCPTDLRAFDAASAIFLCEVSCVHRIRSIIKKYETKVWLWHMGVLVSPHLLKICNEIHRTKLHKLDNDSDITELGSGPGAGGNETGRGLKSRWTCVRLIALLPLTLHLFKFFMIKSLKRHKYHDFITSVNNTLLPFESTYFWEISF